MQWMERKQLLGSGYRYDKWMSEGEVERLKREAPADFSDRTAASLTAGCVRIDTVLFQAGGQLRLGYDVFVRTIPDRLNGSATTTRRRMPASMRGRCSPPSTG